MPRPSEDSIGDGSGERRDPMLFRDTSVSQNMATDSDTGGDRMEKINVRVPSSLLEQIDEKWERRGYSSKSEAIRDALRDWVHSPAPLSDEIVEVLEENRKEGERSETIPADEVRERLGLDD